MAEMYSHRAVIPDYEAGRRANRSIFSRLFSRVFGRFLRNTTSEAKCDEATGLLRSSDMELALRGMTRREIYEHVYMDDTR